MGFVLSRIAFLCLFSTLSFLPFAAQAVTAVDLGTSAGLPARLPSIGESAILDYDGDGLQDIVFSAHGQEWPLLRQGPVGKFTRVLPGTFPAGQDRHGCATADFNADGRPDLYCVRGACEGVCKKSYPNELYLQRANRTFAKIGGAWAAGDPHGRGRAAVALDFDQDGDMDLLVGNERSTAFPKSGNRLWRNDGGKFVEVKPTTLAHTLGTFRIAIVRVPGRFPDVVMRTNQGILYYRNDKGTYQPGKRLGGPSAIDVRATDLDGNGLPDLVIVHKEQLEVRLNDGSFGFGRIDYLTSLTEGRDVAACQLDGKPGRDLYVVQGERPANQDFILLNRGNGKSYQRLATPRIGKGQGDVATCIEGRYPGYLGAAVLVTNNKWFSVGDPNLGPARLMLVKP